LKGLCLVPSQRPASRILLNLLSRSLQSSGISSLMQRDFFGSADYRTAAIISDVPDNHTIEIDKLPTRSIIWWNGYEELLKYIAQCDDATQSALRSPKTQHIFFFSVPATAATNDGFNSVSLPYIFSIPARVPRTRRIPVAVFMAEVKPQFDSTFSESNPPSGELDHWIWQNEFRMRLGRNLLNDRARVIFVGSDWRKAGIRALPSCYGPQTVRAFIQSVRSVIEPGSQVGDDLWTPRLSDALANGTRCITRTRPNSPSFGIQYGRSIEHLSQLVSQANSTRYYKSESAQIIESFRDVQKVALSGFAKIVATHHGL